MITQPAKLKMKLNNHRFLISLSLVVFLSLLSVSCISKADEKICVDLSDDFRFAEVFEETQHLDFQAEETKKFLGQGWSRAVSGGVWASSLFSELRFYTFFPEKDHKAILICSPFVYPQSPEQVVDIYLNANNISTINLTKGDRRYSFELPSQCLQKGENILSFKFSYAASPKEALGKKDTKQRAVKFKSLHFYKEKINTEPIQKKDATLYLPPLTQINYYVQIPENAILRFGVDYEHPGEDGYQNALKLNVLAAEEKGQELSIFQTSYESESSGCRSCEVDLSLFKEKTIRLSFRCEGYHEGIKQSYVILRNPIIEQKTLKAEERLHADRTLIEYKGLSESNLILIILDAASPFHMSCYGYPLETTPYIDQIAAEGILFSRAYSQTSWTVPAIASLFTSTLPVTHRVWSRERMLSDSAFTLAEALKKKGFRTCALTATSSASTLHNLLQGFDTKLEIYKWDSKELRSAKRLGVVWAEDFILPATEWIKKNSKKQFFMYFHFLQPHTPYNPPAAYADEFIQDYSGPLARRRPLAPNFIDKATLNEDDLNFVVAMYDANLKYADSYLGEIFKFLEKLDIFEDTTLIITSDHGEAFLDHGEFGHSSSLFEEEIRIPLIVKFPERGGFKGIRNEALVQFIDIMPTVFDIYGISKKGKMLQGKSLIPLISGNKTEDDRFVFASLSKAFSEGETKTDALIDGMFKIILTGEEKMLFDLGKDPHEKKNIFFQKPILARFYEKKLLRIKEDAESQKDLSIKGDVILDEEARKHLKALGYIK